MSLPPGSTIGILGGGQLGRMMALAAARIGYRCHILDPHDHPCAAEVSALFTRAEFDDVEALQRFGDACDVVTYEFENLPVEPLRSLGDKLRPGVRSLAIAQDRAEEKKFIDSTGGRVAPWRSVAGLGDLQQAIAELGLPLVLKTRRYGYDGKGQAWIRTAGDADRAWGAIGGQPAVAEAGIDFAAEFSIVLARINVGGGCVSFGATENEHKDGILHHSTVPARQIVLDQAEQARAMSIAIARPCRRTDRRVLRYGRRPRGQ